MRFLKFLHPFTYNMKNIFYSLTCLWLASCQSTPIVLEASTLKLTGASEKLLYFGFDEGDEILFSFEELNGRELEAIQIKEYPAFTKYSDLHLTRIDSLGLDVRKKGILHFVSTMQILLSALSATTSPENQAAYSVPDSTPTCTGAPYTTPPTKS